MRVANEAAPPTHAVPPSHATSDQPAAAGENDLNTTAEQVWAEIQALLGRLSVEERRRLGDRLQRLYGEGPGPGAAVVAGGAKPAPSRRPRKTARDDEIVRL